MTELANTRQKTPAKPFDGLLPDILCGFLVSVGVLLALRQLFRFENPFSLILFRSAIVLAITALITRRWWHTVLFVLMVFNTTVLYLFAVDGFAVFYYYITGLFDWWTTLFPVSSEYNTPFNITVVHWVITIWVCVPVFFLIRRIKSLYVIIVFSVVLFALIITNRFRDNFDAVGFIIAGSLPLLAKNNHIKLIRNSDKVLFTTNRILAAGLTLCVLCAILATRVVPKNTTSWKNPALSELLNRVVDSQHKLSRMPFTLVTSGLQPNVDRLGGDIELDHRLVMKVKTIQPSLMKGNIYNIYTGKGWDATDQPAYRYGSFTNEFKEAFSLNIPRSEDGENPLFDAMPVVSTKVALVFGGYSLFYSGRLTQISAGKPAVVSFKTNSELFSQNRLPTRYNYSFESAVFNPGAKNLRARIDEIERQASQKDSALYDSDYEAVCREYLRLPDSLPDYVYQIARKITDVSPSNFEKINLLNKFFRTNFSYTLKPGDVPEGADFVEHFLKTGRGYCTYFATAMAVMSRIAGVPSRFVIGYGLKRAGSSYVAYTDNAHAWVECYFRGVGWIPFDPTAGSSYYYPVTVKAEKKPTPTQTQAAAGTTISGEGPGDTTSQATTTTTAQTSSTTHTINPPKKPDNISPAWGWLAAGTLIIMLAAAAALRVLKQKKAYVLDEVRRRFPANSEQINYYYTDIIRQLRLLGLSPKTSETILQHGRRVQKELDKDYAGSPPGDGTRLLSSFISVMNLRYGNIQPADGDIENISRVHDILENRLKNTLSPFRYLFNRLLFPR